MPKLPLFDSKSRYRPSVGEVNEVNNLWHPRIGKNQALASRGNYWPAKRLNILVQADSERRAKHAVIAFPDTGAAYVVEDTAQLKAIISKLMKVYQHITASGEGQIVSFKN